MTGKADGPADGALVALSGVLLLGLLLVLLTAPAAAAPPEEPDHGVNESTFWGLWSKDAEQDQEGNATENREFANVSDMAFFRPPHAVQKWNQGDVQDFPTSSTGTGKSIYPSSADLSTSSRGWIKDAYVEVFAIDPSTRAFVSPDKQSLYAPSEGSIRGTVDYRVDLPADDTEGDTHVLWALNGAEIESVQAVVRSRTIGTTEPGHVVDVDYSGLTPGTHPVGLEAEISISVTKTVKNQICHNGSCHWESSDEVIEETVTVRDTRQVTRYSVVTSGYLTQYPNGDTGVVVHRNLPWAAVTFPNGDRAEGVWRFYSGRDEAWDNFTVSRADGQGEISSSANPLQVYAYPATAGPTMSGKPGSYEFAEGQIIHSQGEEFEPPELPDTIALDAVNESYNSSWQLAIRHQSYQPSKVAVEGIVANTSSRIAGGLYVNRTTREANLSVSVLNTTRRNLTLAIELTDNVSGAAIETRGWEGQINVDRWSVDTNASGKAVATIPRGQGRITVQYEPTAFWKRSPAYTPDQERVRDPVSLGGAMTPLILLGLATLFLWSPVYAADKMLGTDYWPPWRGIW